MGIVIKEMGPSAGLGTPPASAAKSASPGGKDELVQTEPLRGPPTELRSSRPCPHLTGEREVVTSQGGPDM